jgi:hypothetical protein
MRHTPQRTQAQRKAPPGRTRQTVTRARAAVPSVAGTAAWATTQAAPHTDAIGSVEQVLQHLFGSIHDGQAAAGPPGRRGRGAPLVFSALCLWASLLLAIVRHKDSQVDVWRQMQEEPGLVPGPTRPVTPEAVRKRLVAGGIAPMRDLFVQCSALLAPRVRPYANRTLAPAFADIVALDDMHLDKVARLLPDLRGAAAGDDRLLPGTLAALFDIRLQQWRTILFCPTPHENEKVSARAVLEGLAVGALVVMDLGFFAFPWFDFLTEHRYAYVSRLREKISYRPIHTYYRNGTTLDQLVWLGAYASDKAEYAVRLVSFQVGTTTFRYITNVCDPTRLSIREIAEIYLRRWDIELAFNLLKTHLNLHLLWSANPVLVQQQVWAALLIAQIVQALRMEIAGRAGVDPFDVSMPLMLEYFPDYVRRELAPIGAFIARGRWLRFIRPSSRTTVKAPWVPLAEVVPQPPGLILAREPRYAGKI